MFYNPSMTPEQNAANNLAQIQNSAEWVTDENEQGVYLTVNGTLFWISTALLSV